MGDSRRFVALARFVADNFRSCRVADVAGGSGLLAYELEKVGFDCTVIDTKPHAGATGIKTIKGEFKASSMATKFNLVIGLHPDSATEELAHAAVLGIPTVIVPCCWYWTGIDSHGAANVPGIIRHYWQKNHVPFWETTLKMNGKNLVFVANNGS